MAEPPERIVLVGFMGSGKSSVGGALALLIGWGFVDLDRLIEQRTGLTIPQLFRERGEAAFREEERRAALAAASLTRHVVAAGGGAFARSATRETLRAGALTVWLRCDFDVLAARVPSDGSRPLATSRETMRSLLSERESAYRLADLTVDTTRTTPEEAARQIRDAVL